MLKWLSPASGPFCPRAEFVISHLKIDEMNYKKTDILEKGYFESFKISFASKKTHLY